MAPMSRLERLRKLVQADVDALPDKSVLPEPATVAPSVDNEKKGGIAMDDKSTPAPDNKPPLADTPASPKIASVPAPIEAEPMPDVSAPTNLECPHTVIPEAVSAGTVEQHHSEDIQPTPTSNKQSDPEETDDMLPSPSDYVPLPTAAQLALTDTDLKPGGLISFGHKFTSIQALSKYPYKFCNKADMQDIASAFFDAGKFWDREWDLFYVRGIDPSELFILVKEHQFQQLLDEINKRLKLTLRITDAQIKEGLVTRFPNHPQCLPRYLGCSKSREQYDGLMANPPDQKFRAPGEPSVGPPTSGTLEEFKATLDKLHDAQKTKGKAKREKTYVERVDRQLAMLEQFKRAQRYLSLRSSESAATSGPMQPIDPSLPTSFAFDQSVVFVSVDVESYEKAHHKITEIGVATLDTRDLVGVAPGADGKDWQKIIKARHFRIKEHKHLVNHEFVAGHPEGFDFGDTTFVSLEEAPAYVAACFKQPFGVHTTNTPVETVKSMIDELDFNEKRRIILLGHDTLSDIHYLQQLGFDPLKVDNILEPLDTAKIYQAWRREQNPTNLGRIMANFGVAAWKLHNAGNDAVYTIWAMLATCVREATIRGTPELETMRAKAVADREAAAKEEAAERVKQDANGWSEIEDKTNGGDPVSLKSS